MLRPMSLPEWLGFWAALYVIGFFLVASVLRSLNKSDQRFRRYTTRPAIGWAAMLLPPAAFAFLALWMAMEFMIAMAAWVTGYARLRTGNDG